MELGAIILAGGQSRRMGRNKALLRLTPDGPRLIELVIAAAQSLTSHILISANAPETYAWLGLPCVADATPGAGPLAGLAAGLAASQDDWNLLLGCDMPFVQPDVLRYLAAQIRDDRDAIAPLNLAGRPEPLCALYRVTCLPVIHAQLAAGAYAMQGWLALVRAHFVPVTALLPLDHELRSFQNVNTPQDLDSL